MAEEPYGRTLGSEPYPAPNAAQSPLYRSGGEPRRYLSIIDPLLMIDGKQQIGQLAPRRTGPSAELRRHVVVVVVVPPS